MTPAPLLKVYFDGACHLCSREVEHYKRRDQNRRIDWIDIAHPEFDAGAEGLDADRIQRAMHVRSLSNGGLYTGVDGFIEIWKVLPGMSVFALLLDWSPVRMIARMGYAVFARLRVYLPKRKQMYLCSDGVCRPGVPSGGKKRKL